MILVKQVVFTGTSILRFSVIEIVPTCDDDGIGVGRVRTIIGIVETDVGIIPDVPGERPGRVVHQADPQQVLPVIQFLIERIDLCHHYINIGGRLHIAQHLMGSISGMNVGYLVHIMYSRQ